MSCTARVAVCWASTMLFVDTLGNSSCPRPAALVGAAELHPLELPASLLQRESLFTARARIAGPELLEDENPPKVPASPATVVEEERRVRPAATLVDKATSIGVVPPELLESQAVRRAYQKLPQHGQDTVPALQTTEVWEKDYVDDVNEPDAWAVIRNRPALPAGVRSELDRDYVQRDNEAQLADRSAPLGAGFADDNGEAAVQVLTQAADSGSSADAEKVVEKAAGGSNFSSSSAPPLGVQLQEENDVNAPAQPVQPAAKTTTATAAAPPTAVPTAATTTAAAAAKAAVTATSEAAHAPAATANTPAIPPNTFGPGGCVTLDRVPATGSCIVRTSCPASADLSSTEFAFLCVSAEGKSTSLHSFGWGGFGPKEDYDTGVKCASCLARSSVVRFGPQSCLSVFPSPSRTCVVHASARCGEPLSGSAVAFTCKGAGGVDTLHRLAPGVELKPGSAIDTKVTCAQCAAPQRPVEEGGIASSGQILKFEAEMKDLHAEIAELTKQVNALRAASGGETTAGSTATTVAPKEEASTSAAPVASAAAAAAGKATAPTAKALLNVEAPKSSALANLLRAAAGGSNNLRNVQISRQDGGISLAQREASVVPTSGGTRRRRRTATAEG